LAILGRNKAGGGESNGFNRDPRKARRFFEHAQTTADAGNYDYSIEMYVNGLRFDPDNMEQHEALYEVGKRRKVKGGKAAGLGEKMKSGGSHPLDKMLHAEKLWAMDILNINHMVQVMKFAVEASVTLSDEANSDHPDGGGSTDIPHLAEVAYWIGSIAMESRVQSGKTKKGDKILRELRDNFAAISAFDKAVESCRYMVRLDQDNNQLLMDLKNLEAENTMQQGGYSEAKAEEGGFRNFMRDAAGQQALEQESSLRKTESQADGIIARRREELEKEPDDLDRATKLVDALVAKESVESEREGMELLQKLWKDTETYRFKLRMGDIQIKQMNRIARKLRTQIAQAPTDDQLRQQFSEAKKEQLAFELTEFDERVKNYPTDMGLRFEWGKRLRSVGKIDDAIGAFQQAKQDPKVQVKAHYLLGDCYRRKQWLDEAIVTLREGIATYKLADDRLALDLRYLLMEVLEQSAQESKSLDQAQEARKLASEILRTDINYRNIKQRIDALRMLVEQLQHSGADG